MPALAFALGVTAGMLLRRTLPAMAATLVIFAGIRLAVADWVRPYLLAPLHVISTLQAPTENARPTRPPLSNPATGTSSDQTVNAAGKVIGQEGAISYGGGRYGILFGPMGDGRVTLQGVGLCPNRFPAPGRRRSRRAPERLVQPGDSGVHHQARVRDVLTYQPTRRYWPLQWYEMAIFAGLAVVLAGFCFWWMRRRFA